MKSQKAFAMEYRRDGTASFRVPLKAGEKFDPMVHFLSHEESDYLAYKLAKDRLKPVPYATIKTADPDEMQALLSEGFEKDGVLWTVFFAFWKDQGGRAYLVPAESGVENLSDVGIFTYMKSPGDFMKVGKYGNRILASLQETLMVHEGQIERSGAVWGKEIFYSNENGVEEANIELEDDTLSEEDRVLSIRYMDLKAMDDEQKALADGVIAISEKAVRSLGLSKEPKLGMAWRGTFGTQRGLGKGHILYVKDLSVDIVIYGPKRVLVTDQFFFGSMGPLHVGMPHTDFQAFVNFQFHREGLAVDLARNYMLSVFAASKDTDLLRRTFLRYSSNVDPEEIDNDGWILRDALKYDISHLRFPGLYRKVVRYLAGENSKVFQCDMRARIPMETVASYGYVLPDPNVIDSEGNIILAKSKIPEGHMVFPDVKKGTKVAVYRQPSENSNAWFPLEISYLPEYKRFENRGICLLGRGADKVLKRLGGGDMDDSFVIVHDPKWVEAFGTMRPYPETEKVSAESKDEEFYEASPDELEQFTDELMVEVDTSDVVSYGARHVSWQISASRHARAGIGPVVNYGMIDTLLSDPDHKASMIEDLKAQGTEEADEYASWLEQREPWQAAKLMTNLEIVIDASVKDATLLKQLGSDIPGEIKRFHEDCLVYPSSMVRRIPAPKIEKGDYVTARSLFCRSLERIQQMRTRLLEVFVEREWDLVAPADRHAILDTYAYEPEIMTRVQGSYKYIDGEAVRMDDGVSLKDLWGSSWQVYFSTPVDERPSDPYIQITSLISKELEGESDEMMERIAVHLYLSTYRRFPAYDVDRSRGYNDGLLWSPVFARHFINALREARLTGFIKPAELKPEYRNRLLNKCVNVQIHNHWVSVKDSKGQFTIDVGVVTGRAPDGIFVMDRGLIIFREGQAICQPYHDEMKAPIQPVVTMDPQQTDENEPVDHQLPAIPKVNPRTSFGRLLKKALKVMGMEDKGNQ